ncbi:histidinol-phosphate transaminase [Pseudodesulfovibrio piezophilus]|uniref:Histidinol-phosphate aminotransferase n=1 Tax=Pseudodesulfovibrio piezophilus (strain DSM 21447 / JCM 15486 / C1TLV30) TaxID=1322246 RepID=M1WM58_PSEP2|nr:histidinol-phosphate transaminase [Pseudodesulfovibrio piezophilus]CCH49030.1 Histidinol-phosphate aminotransferase [Pseudodesulfovibrio piezophilus C1TLV30]
MREFSVRSEILDFDPYTPGLTIEQIRERYGLANVIKLASNENPLGASPVVQKVMAKNLDRIFRYPENNTPKLVTEISKHIGVPRESILVGNGSDEIIDMLFRMKARPGVSNVIGYEHSFAMYRMCAKLAGVEYREVKRGDPFELPLDKLAKAADENTAMVFVTSPDNPTGQAASVEDLSVLAGVLPKDCLLVVDEAYIDFVWPPESYTPVQAYDKFDNLVVLRTFSKAYGLAGLRVGYGILPPKLLGYLKNARIPFTVNLLAEEAAIAALNDDAFYNETLQVVMSGREYFMEALPKIGCKVYPSQANFVMFEPTKPAQTVFKSLLKKGIIVRPLGSFGLGKMIRVTIGTEAENKQFIKALGEVLGA